MTPTTSIADIMRQKLSEAFNPDRLELKDQSHMHAGHGGATEHAREHGSGESHFHLVIVAKVFGTQSRLQRHHAIMAALSEEMPRIHALSIDAKAPD